MHHTPAEWLDIYKQMGALWVHDGHPKHPHVRIREDVCVNGFFRPHLALVDDMLCGKAAADLLDLLRQNDFILSVPNRIVAPMRATKFMGSLRGRLKFMRGHDCPASYVIEDKNGAKTEFFGDGGLKSGERVLCGDTLFTAGEGMSEIIKTCEALGARVCSLVPILVNCSEQAEILERKIVSLVAFPIKRYLKGECPLCAAGSEALQPADVSENWNRLIAR